MHDRLDVGNARNRKVLSFRPSARKAAFRKMVLKCHSIFCSVGFTDLEGRISVFDSGPYSSWKGSREESILQKSMQTS